MKIKEMKEKATGLLEQAKAMCDAAIDEGRDLTAEEKQKAENLVTEARSLKEDIKKAQENMALMKEILELGEGLDLDDPGVNGGSPQGKGGLSRMSLGQQFLESPIWREWFKSIAPGGQIAESRKGLTSPTIEMKGGFDILPRKKTLITGSSDTSAGAFVQTDYTNIYEPLGRWPLTLRDLISTRQTDSDTVEFVRQTTQVTQAAPVPEANVTTYSGATGEVSGEKPEGATTFEKVQETVKTIAVWIPATKRALSDAAQLRGLIDQELRDDLAEEFEDQLLNGDGTGENFTGLSQTANVLVQAFTTDILTTTRKAITNLLVNGKQMPTAWVINPNDWEAVDLLQDDQGRYYWGGPMAQGMKTLWGVPVVENFLQPEGTAWLGNWRKMVVWDKEAANISMTDSHADFFIRNMIAILGEMRAAMGVIRPTAFVEVDLSAAS